MIRRLWFSGETWNVMVEQGVLIDQMGIDLKMEHG